jgi:hypothetical protein
MSGLNPASQKEIFLQRLVFSVSAVVFAGLLAWAGSTMLALHNRSDVADERVNVLQRDLSALEVVVSEGTKDRYYRAEALRDISRLEKEHERILEEMRQLRKLEYWRKLEHPSRLPEE